MAFLTSALYLSAFLSLAFWFLFKHDDQVRPRWGKGFLLTFGTFLGTSILVPGAASSWWVLVGQVFLLFGAGFFLNSFSSSKMIFYPLLVLMAGGYVVGTVGADKLPFLRDIYSATPEATPITSLSLDPSAELLLEVSNGHQRSELNSITERYGLILTPAFTLKDGSNTDLDDYWVADVPENQLDNYEEIVAALRDSELLDHVEANSILSLDPAEMASANDAPSRGRRSYAVNDPEIDKVWGYEVMDVEALYAFLSENKIQPAKKARVVIIDTGVDGKHEDLKDNFVSIGTEHNSDPIGHGTHCAGIAAAVSNNGKGIASFVPNQTFVEVSSVKVFGAGGNTTKQTIINGMLLAVDQGADVLSMSLGGPATPSGFRAYKQAVRYANQKGALVVVAAGNENIDASKRLPAAIEGVITVSALDANLSKASFSNRVNNVKMGIAAPGAQIYSTIPGNQYEFFNGTSMATPYVAGLLGVMKALKPDLTTKQAYRLIRVTGKPTSDTEVTGPLIQPAAAVKSLLKK